MNPPNHLPGIQLEINNLTKTFGHVRAVDNLSFTVSPGRVTGFLGPNGAGKTTTLRVLLGLVKADSGTALIDGRPYRSIPRPAATAGAALEAANFHPGRTGRDHLRVFAPQVGASEARVKEVLAIVGLSAAAKRRVGEYSLGMKQRLALATTLLPNPPVLILDEPANGLDPEGIAWLRSFLRTLASEGRTVLISSHMLSEVKQTVDDVVIISHGKLAHASSLEGLTALTRPRVRVVSPDRQKLHDLVTQNHWITAPSEPVPARAIEDAPPAALELFDLTAEQVGAAAFAAGIQLHELTRIDAELEQVFLNLVRPPVDIGQLSVEQTVDTPEEIAS